MKLQPANQEDFYKTGHIFQYPKGTELVYSNGTFRSSTHAKVGTKFDDKIVWFGLQGVLKWMLSDLWNREFFKQPKEKVVRKYKRRMDGSLGQDAVSVDHIAALHDLGYLPLHIKSIAEGSRVNIKVPVYTISNTHPDFFWLTNYIETALSAETWKSATNATIAYEYRKLLDEYAELTGAPAAFVPWQGHDFSMRGMSGIHDAAQSGAAHLLSFLGTDTIPAIDYLEDYYNAENTFVGGSVPATEHSTMCMGIADTDETETFRRLMQDQYPSGIVSIVSDTKDFWYAINDMALELKPVIMNRTPDALGNCKVVFRPDSGDPVEVVCGVEIPDLSEFCSNMTEFENCVKDILRERVCENTEHGCYGGDSTDGIFSFLGQTYELTMRIEWNRHDKQFYYIDECDIINCEPVELTPAQRGAVQCLWDNFGGSVSNKGYKMLDSHVGLIYGDSITLDRANQILSRLKDKGFASSNIVFGIGSYTYQYVTRDTFGMAIKATYGEVNGEARELFKDPVTDNGVKKSAKGLLRVEKVGDDYVLFDQQSWEQEAQGELRTVFLDGILTVDDSLDTIRGRLLGK